jgi:hypothetical protein
LFETKQNHSAGARVKRTTSFGKRKNVIVPQEGVMDDDNDVNTFILERVLPNFVGVVDIRDVWGCSSDYRET